jgi:phosphohistidine phosphatase SixA
MQPLLRRSLLACALAAFAATPLALHAAAQEQGAPARPPSGVLYPRTVIVVRHAEKAAEPANDPPLDERGRARAERLAQLLAHSGVTHLYASEYLRTRETLAPLASATGVNVAVVEAREGRALLSALDSLPRNAVAVVAGHSNTVPGVVERLAPGSHRVQHARETLALTEADFDRVFVVTQWGPEPRDASLLELRY